MNPALFHKKSVLFLLCLCVLSASEMYAQYQGDVYRYTDIVKVFDENNKEKTLAWCGGFNNPQLTMADFNRDGKKDLAVYEKLMGTRTFLAGNGINYKYAPFYQGFFPEARSYLILADYNRDKVQDIFHYGQVGCEAYKGYYDGDTLKFKYFREVRYLVGGYLTNVYSAPNAVPSIVDVDGDGDLDFFSYDQAETSIAFYRNCEKEDGLTPDSLRMCLKDICWGKTAHVATHQLLMAHACSQAGWATCKPTKATDGGNNVCLLDYDGDGDYDLLNGHVAYSDLQFLKNGRIETGHPVDSMIYQDTAWSSNGVTMRVENFPAAFAIDIDNDNDNDILASPMNTSAENRKCYFYENTGSNAHPNYVFRTDSFLISETIDIGGTSYPFFYDYDKDGKKDLFVGSAGYYMGSGVFRSRIAYYRNTSNGTDMSFTQMTTDFMNLDAMNLVGASIAIGDLDNDTLDDLVIGRTDGTFAFFKNTAASNNVQPVWQLAQTVMKANIGGQPVDVGDYATPCIYDVDKDGKNDLVCGNLTGDLFYFNNASTIKGTVLLVKKTENLGGIKITRNGSVDNYSVPYIGPVDDSGKHYLVVGSEWGWLYRFDDIQNSTLPAILPMIDSNYSYLDVRHRAAPAFANVNNNTAGLHHLVIGNLLGGLTFYKQDFPVSVGGSIAVGGNVKVYPNPAKDRLNISWNIPTGINRNVHVQLVSVTGQKFAERTFEVNARKGEIDISTLPSGVYYCVVRSGELSDVKTVSIIR